MSSSSQFIKNLIYFVFIFSFAMLRLWITLLILTFGLKQSYPPRRRLTSWRSRACNNGSIPDSSFGPFRFVEAVPWLIVALACRIVGAESESVPLRMILMLGAGFIAVLLAFMAVMRRTFEMAGLPCCLDDLGPIAKCGCA